MLAHLAQQRRREVVPLEELEHRCPPVVAGGVVGRTGESIGAGAVWDLTPDRRRGQQRKLTEPQIGRAHVELQSQSNLVCRLLLEKKKTSIIRISKPWHRPISCVAHVARLLM